ncbi:hypothetical protein ACJX0J_024365, partial [Zea mays]
AIPGDVQGNWVVRSGLHNEEQEHTSGGVCTCLQAEILTEELPISVYVHFFYLTCLIILL